MTPRSPESLGRSQAGATRVGLSLALVWLAMGLGACAEAGGKDLDLELTDDTPPSESSSPPAETSMAPPTASQVPAEPTVDEPDQQPSAMPSADDSATEPPVPQGEGGTNGGESTDSPDAAAAGGQNTPEAAGGSGNLDDAEDPEDNSDDRELPFEAAACAGAGGVCVQAGTCGPLGGELGADAVGGCNFDGAEAECCIAPEPEADDAPTCTGRGGVCTSVGACLQAGGHSAPPEVACEGGPGATCCLPYDRCGEVTIECCSEGATFRPACEGGELVCAFGEPC
jgi:hypothetical protein